MRRILRYLVVPVALGLIATAALHRALDARQLALAAAVGVAAGVAAGALLGNRRLPLVATSPAAVVIAYVVSGALGGSWSPTAVPDAIYLFLTIGLPATGLQSPALAAFAVAWIATTTAAALALRGRTLASVTAPGAVLASVALTVVPIGISWIVPALFVAGAGGALLLDARLDLSDLTPLVGTNTESRRHLVWWRALVQLTPAVLAVALAVVVRPVERAVDIRDAVDPAGVRLEDVSALAVAARTSQVPPEEARPLATVEVGGTAPVGRMRVAVLDRYDVTGWRQSAEFTETGRQLAPDPLFDDIAHEGAEVPVRVRVAADAPLSALPTAANPLSVISPQELRYAPQAEVLLPAKDATAVAYRSRSTRPREAVDATVASFPEELVACPESQPIRAVAAQLVTGTTSALERLDRIESFLKVRRVFDPAAPGGQTLRSVERFVEQDFARGNLEVFVSAHALLARCAGVPVRVVVGLPAPEHGVTRFTDRDLTAWVETPLARSGWVVVDPLPTPEEQLQQAQLARRPDPASTSTTAPPNAGEQPEEVPPLDIEERGRSSALVVAAAFLLVIVLLIALWMWLVPRIIRSRRRRAADPSMAVLAAWQTVADALADRDLPVESHHTPSDVGRVVGGRVPLVVPRLIEGLAPLVDSAHYSGLAATDEDAGRAWAFADAIVDRLPSTRRAAFVSLVRPRLTLERVVASRRIMRRRRPWRGSLPEAFLVAGTEAPQDVPGVAIAARIGEGATGAVYRGALAPNGEAVAVKVFRYGPGDTGFDPQRFEWEVRVAREVSGRPHLPIVHDAGITPMTGRPYIVTTLYDGGTLLERVGRGGAMTEAEVTAMGGDLALALITMHQLGVVHADVKPENVFFGSDGWVLGDLGSAWLRASRGPAASLTPPYAAPEVWRGGAPTPLADLYSLGLTMLFAAAGRVPIAGVPPTRDEVVELFPEHPVMLRALEPDARRRPRTATEFLRQLRPEMARAAAGSFLATLSLPTPTVTHAPPKPGSLR